MAAEDSKWPEWLSAATLRRLQPRSRAIRQASHDKQENDGGGTTTDEGNVSVASAKEATFGFTKPQPVQRAVLPLLCRRHKDVVVRAVTGSGKTLAYLIPVVELIRQHHGGDVGGRRGALLGLVLAPTRELATQISRVASVLLLGTDGGRVRGTKKRRRQREEPGGEKANKIKEYENDDVEEEDVEEGEDEMALPDAIPFAAVIGGTGTSAEEEARSLIAAGDEPGKKGTLSKRERRRRMPQVIIGTPGRVLDVLPRIEHAISLRELLLLVLDEADRLLSLGFEREVLEIIKLLPRQRRTGLFSATQGEAIEELVKKVGMQNPVRVTVLEAKEDRTSASEPASAAGAIPAGLACHYTLCESDAILSQVSIFLSRHCRGLKSIVYFMTCACVDLAATTLPVLVNSCQSRNRAEHIAFVHLHGRMKQAARERALRSFAEAEGGAVLLATDVAARGLDIPGVDWVIQVRTKTKRLPDPATRTDEIRGPASASVPSLSRSCPALSAR